MVTKVSDVMTRQVAVIAPDSSLREAARRMDEFDIGALPVCDGDRVVGILTDRDITVRATAAGQAPDATRVDEVMTEHVRLCHATDPVSDVLDRMGRDQIRRMPVLDGEERLVGIVALGDFSADRVPGADEALRRISSPAEPDLTGTISRRRAASAGVLADHAPRGAQRSNDLIRQDVCELLAADPLDDSAVDVEVSDGAVTLGGTVGSFEEKRQAEALVTKVAGVATIINNLRMRKSRPAPR